MEKGLDHTEGTDMEGTLADPVKIRQWQVRRENLVSKCALLDNYAVMYLVESRCG